MLIGISRLYVAKTGASKKIPNIVRGLNWLLLGTVYLSRQFVVYELGSSEYHATFRIVVALLFLGELAYNTDVIMDMYCEAREKVLHLGESGNHERGPGC